MCGNVQNKINYLKKKPLAVPAVGPFSKAASIDCFNISSVKGTLTFHDLFIYFGILTNGIDLCGSYDVFFFFK